MGYKFNLSPGKQNNVLYQANWRVIEILEYIFSPITF